LGQVLVDQKGFILGAVRRMCINRKPLLRRLRGT